MKIPRVFLDAVEAVTFGLYIPGSRVGQIFLGILEGQIMLMLDPGEEAEKLLFSRILDVVPNLSIVSLAFGLKINCRPNGLEVIIILFRHLLRLLDHVC